MESNERKPGNRIKINWSNMHSVNSINCPYPLSTSSRHVFVANLNSYWLKLAAKSHMATQQSCTWKYLNVPGCLQKGLVFVFSWLRDKLKEGDCFLYEDCLLCLFLSLHHRWSILFKVQTLLCVGEIFSPGGRWKEINSNYAACLCHFILLFFSFN